MNFDHLKGKTCVITGGGGVLGTSMADALASVGMKVVILDLNPGAAEKLVKQISEKYSVEALGLAANVLDKKSLEEAKKTINDKFGPIHYLVNGAGGNSPKATTKVEQLIPGKGDIWTESFYGLDMEGFRFVFDLNFLGTLLPTMVFTTDMLEAGKGGVINISSMNAIKPLTKIPAYSAAKSAINNFTEWLAVHLGKTGIRVNAIAPGFFLTNQNRFLLTDEKTGKLTPRGEKIISSTPMGKFGNPEDLSGTLLFLLSDLSEFITGIVVPVDGGFSAFGGV
ncbi:SDR family oxidoreductase [Perlabentimonas gracilis]|uniref:SDR family oxidoreductase n=1 Tax=Perlabentimonas gracilis TaxID=2715279 RepID=UPI001C62930E|nr:SDR family oxidoreductase [Perlabentimonas gracilis]